MFCVVVGQFVGRKVVDFDGGGDCLLDLAKLYGFAIADEVLFACLIDVMDVRFV